jgi:hypothetical protein
VRLHGASFRIQGGRCMAGAVLFRLAVGLADRTPTAPAKSFGLTVVDPHPAHAGTFKPFGASIQLRGRTYAMGENPLKERPAAVTLHHCRPPAGNVTEAMSAARTRTRRVYARARGSDRASHARAGQSF